MTNIRCLCARFKVM